MVRNIFSYRLFFPRWPRFLCGWFCKYKSSLVLNEHSTTETLRLGTTTTSSIRFWACVLPNFRNQMHMRKTEKSGRLTCPTHSKEKNTISVLVIGLRLLKLLCSTDKYHTSWTECFFTLTARNKPVWWHYIPVPPSLDSGSVWHKCKHHQTHN